MTNATPGAATPSRRVRMPAAGMALALRYRFVAPLCAGRVVYDEAGPSAHGGAFAAARGVVGPRAAAEIAVALAACPSDALRDRLDRLTASLTADGSLVVAVAGALDPAMRTTLSARFATVTVFVQRAVSGSLFAAADFAASRMAALADGPAAAGAADAGCTVVVCAPTRPSLDTGLFESALPPDAAPPPVAASPAQMPWRREHAPPDRRATERADAVSLVERLMDLDAAIVSLRAENRALRGAAGTAVPREIRRPDPIARADAPGPAFSWPLRENPTMPRAELELYDRRPDDDAIEAAAAGAAFLAHHGLLGTNPDFAAAVAALNAIPEAGHAGDARPDVSIVIPVYGQLAYTLNCLDGLLRHRSAHRAEIIVVDDLSPDGTALFLPQIRRVRVHRSARNGGFIAACNAGAGLARGGFIVLLNNDTRPLPGWLDELIDAFALFPKAGLVGSKLLYPDGALQEAGGIVWRDGGAWNYGRNDDPNRPRYCHAREVDYISGASVAIPAGLWRKLRGLDARYAPAYFEDTDLAFRIRANRLQVWMQPTSRIIHYEGRTSGTDVASGAKAYQTVNEGKFRYRWHETLLRHGDDRGAVYVERERQVLKRALLLDDTTPTPREDAGSNYTLLTMRLFIALGYKLSFVPQDNFLYQHGHTTDLHRIGVECAYAPYELGTDVYLSRYGDLFDVVMVSRMQVLGRVIDELSRFAPRAPVLFNTHDLNFLRMRRAAELAGDPAMAAAAEEMRERELALMRRVDCIVTPSAYEGDILARELPDIPTRVLPIMTDLQGTKIGFAERRDVCFLGGYRHPPNIDAVRFFLDRIFPLLKAEEPGMRFIMAGANPTAELLALARDDVVVTGMVDDLRDVFDTVRVFVCPLRVGAGAKGKVASAMSYGLPIVSTAIGAEGMGLAEGETVLIADEPAEFARACLRLYRDEALWRRMSAASLDLVARITSPQAREKIFADAIDAALRHKLKVAS